MIEGIDWFGMLGLVGLWLLVFGNDAIDALLAWRFPEARRWRAR